MRFRKDAVGFGNLLRALVGIPGVICSWGKLVRKKRLDVKSVRRSDLLRRGIPRNVEDIVVIPRGTGSHEH